MIIDGKQIATALESQLKKEFRKYTGRRAPAKLVTFLVGESNDQLSFVRIKHKLAKQLGIDFEFIHFKNIPMFQDLVRQIKDKSLDPKTSGIIIQQPLPAQLQTDSIYNFIDLNKEIEGHKYKSPFVPPLGLAVLTAIKYVYSNQKVGKDLFINIGRDTNFFKKALRNKKVLLVGCGLTGGRPISAVLNLAKINFLTINSQTENPEQYFEQADIIITAVGKKVIFPEKIKPGVILINIGMRRENGKLLGDYDEKDIKNTASFFTPTPGGIGPIDVLYLYKNLLDAVKLQKRRK